MPFLGLEGQAGATAWRAEHDPVRLVADDVPAQQAAVESTEQARVRGTEHGRRQADSG